MKRPTTSKVIRPPSSSSILGKKSYMTIHVGERDYYDSSSDDSLMVVKKLVPSLKTSHSASNLRTNKSSSSIEGRQLNNISTLNSSSPTNTGKDLSRSSSASALLKIPTLSLTSSSANKMVKPSFKMLTPDNIIHILGYFGGEFQSCVSKGKIIWSKFFKTWYGRLSDETVRLLYVYGDLTEAKNSIVDEISFLCAAQLPFGSHNLEIPLIKKLCFCPYKFTDTEKKVATIVREADVELKKKLLRRLDNFKVKNRYICDSLKILKFSQLETFWEAIEKCFEVFPNFEELRIGFIHWETPDFVKFIPRSYNYRDTLASALAKSNRKCKKIESRGLDHFLTPKLAQYLPLLEEYKTVYSYSSKHLKDIGMWKNLKILDCDLRGLQGSQKPCNHSVPEFFKSLAHCKKLECFRMQDDCLYADEFKHLANALPNLKYLNLYSTKTEPDIIETIETFTSLKTLILSESFDDEIVWLDRLNNIDSLEYLEISGSLNFSNFVEVCKLTSLKTLSVQVDIGDEAGKQLANLTNLEQLELQSCRNCKNPFTYALCLFLQDNLKNVKRFNIQPHYSVHAYNHIPIETLKTLQSYIVKKHILPDAIL
ncbi:predicted protein [Naegleria gruberi]|uniref:Predicted protein n=1 Tax=Naegleria gruberi TaxID=5762 RepID=D2VJK3_NAEGR|nr:uncharacterized protein NAEGRDRAFT_69069 [Naegleria gruberi]EFC42961.1 predicted protein [Naegleria gruberi]|eukprot:XP_002675705.1 predicted protein [Naegleria gruberi strain NEG-M]